jgi:hygromycin-B 4-O-kinase
MKVIIKQVQQFLDEQYKGKVTDLSPLSGGEWSDAFAFKHQDRDYVARFGKHREDYVSDQFAGRYASEKLPIPKVLEIGQALGGYFAISERAFGTMLDDQDKAAMRATIPSIFATLDAIRETDVSGTSGFGMWDSAGNGKNISWQEFLLDVIHDRSDSKIHGWKAKLKDAPSGDMAFHAAYANLTKLAHNLPEVRTLIHNDLMHFNVLIDNHHITAVIDWANAMYGDFLYDLAMFTFWEPLHEPVKGIDWEAEALAHYKAIGLEVPEFKKRLQCCMVHMGLGAQTYFAYTGNWNWFEPVAQRTLEISTNKY